MKEKDQFIATVRKVGDSIGVIIPRQNVIFSGLKEGLQIKVWYDIVKK